LTNYSKLYIDVDISQGISQMKKPPKSADELEMLSGLISQAEAARLRGVTRAAISDLIRRGKIRSVRVAGRELVFRDEIHNYKAGAAGRPRRK
jgi:excisionase family DNA binding protein